MKSKLVFAALSALFLFSTTVQAQAPLRQADDGHNHKSGLDPKLLLKADQVHSLNEKRVPLLVDVRSRFEFSAEHIQNAVSYPYSTIKISKKFPFPKDKMIVLYCGCPHHLSGLSAMKLKENGYKSVYIIDEGYWGWKRLGHPIVVNKEIQKQRRRVSMEVSGQVKLANADPAAYEDIFLLHPKTGQLEATRTDDEGRFRMHLHFSGIEDSDPLEFQLRDQTLQRLAMSELTAKKDQPFMLQLPLRVAQK